MVRLAASRGVFWEVLRLYRMSNSISVYYPEPTPMISARSYLSHYHCDWLQDKLAFPYTDLLTFHRDTPVKASVRIAVH